jgi:hypothetical protein
MRSDVSTRSVRALEDAPVGQAIVVRQIHFEGIRSDCDRNGVREGQEFRLNAETDSHLLLEARDGSTARLRREWARFVEVESLGDSESPSHPVIRSRLEYETHQVEQRDSAGEGREMDPAHSSTVR